MYELNMPGIFKQVPDDEFDPEKVVSNTSDVNWMLEVLDGWELDVLSRFSGEELRRLVEDARYVSWHVETIFTKDLVDVPGELYDVF